MEAMTNNNASNPQANVRSGGIVDSQRVLESLASELECLLQEAPAASGSDLVRLHGALLAYDLDGQAALLPTPRLGLSARSRRERRMVQLARRLMTYGGGDHALTMRLAADEIARHLHVIDPELVALAA